MHLLLMPVHTAMGEMVNESVSESVPLWAAVSPLTDWNATGT